MERHHMSPESQRVALAELCGWEFVPGNRGTMMPDRWRWYAKDDREQSLPPDYLNDLNAIDDATWRLSPTQFSRFLTELTAFPNLGRCADARERAKCILRACGKWVEAAVSKA